MRGWRWVLGAVVLAGLLASIGIVFGPSGEQRACPLVGCMGSRARVEEGTSDLRGPGRTVRFCIDDQCAERAWDPSVANPALVVVDTGEARTASSASFTVEEGGAEVVSYQWSGDVSVKETRPNGKGCAPVCRDFRFAVQNEELHPA